MTGFESRFLFEHDLNHSLENTMSQMPPFSIQGAPPSKADIQNARKAAGSAEDAFFGGFMITPILPVDLAVGAAAAYADETRNGAQRRALADVDGAVSRDWSASTATQAYVEKVRKMQRPLIAAEVEDLEMHLRIESATSSAVTGITRVALDAASTLLREMPTNAAGQPK
jgi:hypothetical protein